ncbi:AAA family ATPase [Streptacidiphilus anmyonensis]|uniref:AAA family ATPase n=1 Tax=Streptacidiphilus anmyonensis TaxID=405782 RepID=UPI0005A73E93|nr:ATP-binding protein [Streptacidiphilus anmyonensis]
MSEATELVGRAPELAALRRLWASPRRSAGAVFVLAGEPGIGKTALLDAARRFATAAGDQVMATVGVEAEARLPFAGLHRMLRRVRRHGPPLREPEREALSLAFGESESTGPVELALINRGAALLLRRAAALRPVTLLVDDIQWVDPPSREVLGFLAGRARDLGLRIVATQRPGPPAFGPEALAELRTVDRLTDEASRLMLRSRGALLGPERERLLLQQADGNPLALRELAVDPGEDGGCDGLSARLERAFGSRGADLPAGARDVLLVAAVDSCGDLEEIRAAASLLTGLTVTEEDVAAAVRARLVRVGEGELRFRHPLVRSGVLRGEAAVRRRHAHRALAQVVREPFRLAWHRAGGVAGHDDAAADLLAQAAESVLGRGAVLSAVEALERAATLTTSRPARGRRLLRAAELAFDLGRGELVERLVAEAMTLVVDELDRARGQWLREIFSDGVPGDALRVLELCTTARRAAAAGDHDLALNLLLGAALRCWWAETGPEARASVVDTADALVGAGTWVGEDPRWLAALAVGEPVLRGRYVCGQLDRLDPVRFDDPASLRLLGMAAHAVGHEVKAADMLDRAELLLRRQGRIGLLAHVLSIQVTVRCVLGHWDAAEAAVAEGLRLAEETGQPVWTSGTTVCHAQVCGLRGDAEAARRAAAQAEIPARSRRLTCLLSCVGLARGLAGTAEGDDQAAFGEYLALFDPASAGYHPRQSFDGVALFAESAVRAGRIAQGRAVLRRLEDQARITPAPLLAVQLPYARAVLADEAEAGTLFEAALAQDLDRWPWMAARLDLAYGAWLRRTGERAAARTALEAARRGFADLGAVVWTGRAQAEIDALR